MARIAAQLMRRERLVFFTIIFGKEPDACKTPGTDQPYYLGEVAIVSFGTVDVPGTQIEYVPGPIGARTSPQTL
ncbi:MAG: hypothetical protein CM1200mP18_06710 [Gammaproteobacteria bacterium]|nr:MAG: hypothetical protein CM1200mP18_06710 [Gammaproteobacteria bacterium]